jgi:AraC-like DNA-binding protein
MEFVLKNFKKEIVVQRLANIHYFEFTKNFHTTNDSHDFPELVYVDKGKIDIISENYTGELKAGQLIIHGSGETHSLTCNETVAPNIIIIGFECASPELEKLTHEPLLLTDELQKMIAEIVKEARTVYLPPYDIPNLKDMKKKKKFAFGADQLIKNYLQIFLIKALRLLGTAETIPALGESGFARISEIKKYIDDNFTEKIAVEELCFLFNTNKTTLSSEFKIAYGKTLIDYVNTLRVEFTKKNLIENGYSLTKISEMLNLSSVHYLTALFKKQTGISPTDFLKSREKNKSPSQ